MVLRTAGEICESIEDGARDHWHEHVRARGRRGGRAAAHRRRLRASCASAGLVSLPLSAAYGGYGLPFLVNSAYLEMIARADSSLMTIVGLQAGVAHDIEIVRQRRDQAALSAGLRQRRVSRAAWT